MSWWRQRHLDISQSLPLGWAVRYAKSDGKPYYVCHLERRSSWIHPRDWEMKPHSFADCNGDELPYGWEEEFDKEFGWYFIDHVHERNQIDDPREMFLGEKGRKLAEYVENAKIKLLDKEELRSVRKTRLRLAEEKVEDLANELREMEWGREGYGRQLDTYEAERLRGELAEAKRMADRLKIEYERSKAEVDCHQEGLRTLERVNERLSFHGSYRLEEARAVVAEIKEIQLAVERGEGEKAELMLQLAELRDDLSSKLSSKPKKKRRHKHQHQETSERPESRRRDVATTKEYRHHHHHHHRPTQVEMELETVKDRVSNLEGQLVELSQRPGIEEHERLVLLGEKEQLLDEMKQLDFSRKSKEDKLALQSETERLETEVLASRQYSNKIMSERLALEEEKSLLLQKLRVANKVACQLEVQLMSERSNSQARADLLYRGGSQQSLISAASNDTFFRTVQEAKTNRMSFGELYERVTGSRPEEDLSHLSSADVPDVAPPPEYALPPRFQADPYFPTRSASEDVLVRRSPLSHRGVVLHRDSSAQTDDEDNVANAEKWFRRRAGFDRRRSGRGGGGGGGRQTTSDQGIQTDDESTSASALFQSETRPIASSVALQTSFDAEESEVFPDGGELVEEIVAMAESTPLAYEAPPMELPSPVSSPELVRRPSRAAAMKLLREQSLQRYTDSSSYAVAARKKRMETAKRIEEKKISAGYFREGSQESLVSEVFKENLEAENVPQVQVAIKYDVESKVLFVSIYEARNLVIEGMNKDSRVYVQVELLPFVVPPFRSKPIVYAISHMFHQVFEISIEPEKMIGRILQITLWHVYDDGDDDCLGGTQIGLSDFKGTPYLESKWYNVLTEEDAEEAAKGQRKRKYSLSVAARRVLSTIAASRSAKTDDRSDSSKSTMERRRSFSVRRQNKKPVSDKWSMLQRHVTNPAVMSAGRPERSSLRKISTISDLEVEEKTERALVEPRQRSSVDLELDLEISKAEHKKISGEITNLREIRNMLEERKRTGDNSLPDWFFGNEQLQALLVEDDSESVSDAKSEPQDRRKQLVRKASEEVLRVRRHQKRRPENLSFREKMTFFTTAKDEIPSIPPDVDSTS